MNFAVVSLFLSTRILRKAPHMLESLSRRSPSINSKARSRIWFDSLYGREKTWWRAIQVFFHSRAMVTIIVTALQKHQESTPTGCKLYHVIFLVVSASKLWYPMFGALLSSLVCCTNIVCAPFRVCGDFGVQLGQLVQRRSFLDQNGREMSWLGLESCMSKKICLFEDRLATCKEPVVPLSDNTVLKIPVSWSLTSVLNRTHKLAIHALC